jgi:hypothetical protein
MIAPRAGKSHAQNFGKLLYWRNNARGNNTWALSYSVPFQNLNPALAIPALKFVFWQFLLQFI